MTIQSKRNPPRDPAKPFTYAKRHDGSYVEVTVQEAERLIQAVLHDDKKVIKAIVQILESKKVG